jgi:hypothetical protein
LAEKIGQILIRKGKITPAQLREALRTQQFFGGYLGSHLINLGFLDEASLGETLSEIYRVPFAPFESIRLARPEVIQRVPAALAQRYRIVPLQIEGNRIHLAMLNPRDAVAANEVAMSTGLTVTPWVAPEFRIVQALEKHYKMRRQERGPITMKMAAETPVPSEPEEPSPPPRPLPPSASAVEPEDMGLDGHPLDAIVMPDIGGTARPQRPHEAVPRSLEEWRDSEVEEAVGRLDPGADRRPRPAAARPTLTQNPPALSSYGEEDEFPLHRRSRPPGAVVRPSGPTPGRTLVREATARRAPVGERTRPPLQARKIGHAAPPTDERSLEQLSGRIAASTTREELAEEIVGFMAARYRRVAMFAVRQDVAYGWAGAGPGLDLDRLLSLVIQLKEPSIFSPVQASQSIFVGLPIPGPRSQAFYAHLGATAPPNLLLVPVVLRDRLVAILYADNLNEALGGIDMAIWKRLAQMVAMSLEILILKNRVRKM